MARSNRSINDIAYEIAQAAPHLEPLVEEWFASLNASEAYGALGRIRAAALSDADLAQLPALRDYLLSETRVPRMSVLPVPTAGVGIKLASIAVHVREAASPTGNSVDLDAAVALTEDPEVAAYCAELDRAGLLPAARG